MKTKTQNLTGPALDWAVANAAGVRVEISDGPTLTMKSEHDYWTPSTDWAQGGPIIERERITIDGSAIVGQWMAVVNVPNEEPWEMRATTPLIAAMRCYVASVLGDEIEIPEAMAC